MQSPPSWTGTNAYKYGKKVPRIVKIVIGKIKNSKPLQRSFFSCSLPISFLMAESSIFYLEEFDM